MKSIGDPPDIYRIVAIVVKEYMVEMNESVSLCQFSVFNCELTIYVMCRNSISSNLVENPTSLPIVVTSDIILMVYSNCAVCTTRHRQLHKINDQRGRGRRIYRGLLEQWKPTTCLETNNKILIYTCIEVIL